MNTRTIERADQIGNVVIETAQEIAAKAGYPVFLGGVFEFSDDHKDGRDFMPGKYQSIEVLHFILWKGGALDDLSSLREGQYAVSINPVTDVLSVSIWESCGHGQTSRAVFGRV